MYDTHTSHDELYIDLPTRSTATFQIFIGARGTGKTFSVLRGELNNKFTGEKFIYLRNTNKECQIAVSEFGNAFKSLNKAFGTNITGEYNSQLSYGEFYDQTDEENDVQIGYSFGLSTFAGARSVDLSDVDRIVFEEFIPEMHVRKMRNRGQAFLNFYETLARNREIDGLPPVKVYFLANAINLSDEILYTLGAVNHIQSMVRNSEKRRSIPDRDLYIELVDTVGIVGKKKETALYKMAGDEFTQQALTADFHHERLELIRPNENLRQYKAEISYGLYTVYRHKDNGRFHIAHTGEPAEMNLQQTERRMFQRIFAKPYVYHLAKNNLTFDSYETRVYIEANLNLDRDKL